MEVGPAHEECSGISVSRTSVLSVRVTPYLCMQVINSGDALGFLCGNYYPPTRHRVIQPPKDQVNMPRLGAFYFSMASDNTPLTPHKESPILQKTVIDPDWDPADPPTMGEWRKARSASYGQVKLKKGKDANTEVETVAGITVKHYN
jgi:isopenicillin N synthase-like dioxygenase